MVPVPFVKKLPYIFLDQKLKVSIVLQGWAAALNSQQVEGLRLREFIAANQAGLEKTRVFLKKKKPAQWVFLGFWGFLGFFTQTRGFLGFFSVS
jgi:hypothetical protein